MKSIRPRFEFEVHYFLPWISKKKIMLVFHGVVVSVSRSGLCLLPIVSEFQFKPQN